jgi:CHASE3 domain sensor protein
MKKFLKLKQKTRIAGTFGLLFMFFIVLGLYSTQGIESITHSFRSMYEDRLIPEMDVSVAMSRLYENRVNLENHITSTIEVERKFYETKIQRNNRDIDSLIRKIGATYLVPEEKKDLKLFSEALQQYRSEENEMIIKSRAGESQEALRHLTHEGDVIFQNALKPLTKLGIDQKMVGEELFRESLEIARRQKILAYSITFGAVVTGLILAFALTFASVDVD